MKQKYKDDIKKNCKKDAESMVDTLFDNELFNPKLKRKNLRAIEELLLMNTYDKIISHIKGQELLDSMEIRLEINRAKKAMK